MLKTFKGKNFLIETVKQSKSGQKTVFISSGYTQDIRGLKENWIRTQVRTLFKKDRSNLPDPLIFKTKIKCLEENDVTIKMIFFTPECSGIEEASMEIAEYLVENYVLQGKEIYLVGHSKGGLLFGNIPNSIKKFYPQNIVKMAEKSIKIALISPTFGTIFGDEDAMMHQLQTYATTFGKKIVATTLKRIIKLVGSRRPIDKDMAEGSDFLKNMQEEGFELKNYNSLLMGGYCTKVMNLQDEIFRKIGFVMGIESPSDGMVSLTNQGAMKNHKPDIVVAGKSHPTILNSRTINSELKRFIFKR